MAPRGTLGRDLEPICRKHRASRAKARRSWRSRKFRPERATYAGQILPQNDLSAAVDCSAVIAPRCIQKPALGPGSGPNRIACRFAAS